MGTAWHTLMEQYAPKGDLTEKHMAVTCKELEPYRLEGTMDHFIPPKKTLRSGLAKGIYMP
jgi:hypothetical protein